MSTGEFPVGDRDPEGGYRVGDRVGIFHSDHEEYIFDNPTGVVTSVDETDMDEWLLTVQVDAVVTAERVYLIERKESE